MTSSRPATLGELVLAHPEYAKIFTRHRIDFCCQGHRTVEEACASRGLDVAELRAELARAEADRAARGGDADVRGLATAELIAHIVTRHHRYLRQALPYVTPLVAKVARVHGEHNPKLPALEAAFRELRDTLEPHLDDEEQALFPALIEGADLPALRRSLAEMLEEHAAVGALLATIRSLADGFSTPAWGCGSYRALMTELEQLEQDTLRHVHLENHALAPRFAAC